MCFRTTLLLVMVVFTSTIQAQRNKDNKNFNELTINTITVRYDPQALRIPGNTIPIGITTVFENGRVLNTKGFLNGTIRWNKFRIEVEDGTFSFGKIRLNKSVHSKRNECFTVNVYSRKGKKLLRTQEIFYNYETGIKILTTGKYALAPGNQIGLGMRTFYNNESYIDSWFTSSRNTASNFALFPDGGYISGNKLTINSDPFTIKNHTVSLVSSLVKDRDICDTLTITLDYIDNYSYHSHGSYGTDGFSGMTGGNGGDGGNGSHGHDLDVFVDVYYDTIINTELMYLQVQDLFTQNARNYLINPDGGEISIYTQGGNGGDGGCGGHGVDGVNGSDGSFTARTEKINDSTTVTITEQGPGQNGGDGGRGGDGGDGGYGGNGGNIQINYTTHAEPFLYMVNAQSVAGRGGSAGSGGSGGCGGKGGAGNPTGRNGNNGSGGVSGFSGMHGSIGEIYYNALVSEEELEQ